VFIGEPERLDTLPNRDHRKLKRSAAAHVMRVHPVLAAEVHVKEGRCNRGKRDAPTSLSGLVISELVAPANRRAVKLGGLGHSGAAGHV
jgi:hypothetical protein